MALTGENTTANPSGNSEESEGARSEADRAARPFAAPAPATSSGGTEASASSTLGGAGETPPATKAGDAKADEPASRSVPGWPPSLASPFGASPFGPPPESQARGFGHGVASSTPKMFGFSLGAPAAPAAGGGFNFGSTAPDKTETKTPVSAAPAVGFRSGAPLGAGIGLGGTGTKDAPATAGFSFGAPVSPAFGSGLGGLASAGPSTAFPFGLGGSSANANAPNSTKGWSPFSGACTAESSTKQNGWLFSSAPSFAAESVPVPKSGRSRKKTNRAFAKSDAADSLEGYERYRLFLDKLADSNVDDYVDLPMIAVMGDTSSGKSSLLSNISLVELPSSDSLTTRCPVRLQMRHAASRKASVRVAWKDAPEGDSVVFAERTAEEDAWHTLTDIIAEAQEHIVARTGKEVARDVICVDVEGPHCENLTLIDLPGIVRATGKFESSTVPEDIQALMQEYLDNERCVILAVHPSNVDFHNSQILAEAKKADKETKRTIPVLTKPDLIDDGAETSVKDLLLGEKTDMFEMGYHMIKCRGQKDLKDNVSIEVGLTREEAFFRSKEPWRSVSDKSKFGTKNLRAKLAQLQVKLIQGSLAPIITEMQEERDEAARKLANLGDIPSTLKEKKILFRKVKDEVLEGVGFGSLSGRIGRLHSDADSARPSAAFHTASKEFQQKLQSSKLANVSSIQVGTAIIAVVHLDGKRKEVRDTVCFVDEENDNLFVFSETKPTSRRSKKINEIGKFFKHNNETYHTKEDGSCCILQPIPRKLARSDPLWLTRLIEKNRPYNLPIFLNPDLFDAIVAEQIEFEWKSPAMELLDLTAATMESACERFINGMEMINSLPSLVGYLIRRSRDAVQSIKKDTLDELTKFIEREKDPYTQNHYLFENLSKLRTQRLLDEVLSSVALHSGADSNVSTETLSLDIQSIFERNQRQSIDDHMAEEMLNALDSYGKVAFKRFVDTVPMISIQIMQRFPKLINDIFSDVTDSEIDALIVAPAETISNMADLKKKVQTLEKGIETFEGMLTFV